MKRLYRLAGLIRKERGQALVEMALVIPVLILLFVGICEFGRVLGAFMVINNLAREGARYGVVGHNDLEIENLVLAEKAWLDENSMIINITPGFAERRKGEPLDIEINYSVDLMTPFFSHILPDPVPISARCDMRIE